MSSKFLTLCLPDIHHLNQIHLDTLPHWREWIDKATSLPGAGDVYHELQKVLQNETQSELGLAALYANHEGIMNAGSYYCLATPLHLIADANAVYFNEYPLHLEPEQQSRLCELIDDYVSVIGMRAHAGDHGIYLVAKEPMGLIADAPQTHIAYNIHELSPKGGDNNVWSRLFVEMQMLLNQTPIVASTDTGQQLPVNALWFWGGGQLPSFAGNNMAIFGNGKTAKALAYHCIHQSFQPRLPTVADITASAENVLVIPEVASIGQLADLFNTLHKCLENKSIEKLQVSIGDGKLYVITSRSMRKWWWF